jgi:hypothetical protein
VEVEHEQRELNEPSRAGYEMNPTHKLYCSHNFHNIFFFLMSCTCPPVSHD